MLRSNMTDLGVLDSEVIVVRRRLLRGAVKKGAGALAGLGITAPAATKRRRNNEDCGRVAGVGVRGPLTHSCPNGAAHTSPGQRPGNQATHISAFSRNAADGRIPPTGSP